MFYLVEKLEQYLRDSVQVAGRDTWRRDWDSIFGTQFKWLGRDILGGEA